MLVGALAADGVTIVVPVRFSHTFDVSRATVYFGRV